MKNINVFYKFHGVLYYHARGEIRNLEYYYSLYSQDKIWGVNKPRFLSIKTYANNTVVTNDTIPSINGERGCGINDNIYIDRNPNSEVTQGNTLSELKFIHKDLSRKKLDKFVDSKFE